MMEWEAPNPLTPALEKALVSFPAPLKKIRELSLKWVNEGRIKLDCYGEMNPVEVMSLIRLEHPELENALDEMAAMADGSSVQIMPGSQPHLENYIGGFDGDVTKKPIINVGSGANKEPGSISYDPFHYHPEAGKYGESDVIKHEEYIGLRLDKSVPKCSRGVLQKITPDNLPAGDQVHIVPDFVVWQENGAATFVDDGTYRVIDFKAAGGPVGGVEYDHKKHYGFCFDIGWHSILFLFVERMINHCYEKDGPIPADASQTQLVRPGRDSDLLVVKKWTEKLDGVLCHLYCDGTGKSYLYGRGSSIGKIFKSNSPCCHLLLEKVKGKLYLLGGMWNMIKLHQHPEMLEYFLSRVSIKVGDDVIVNKAPLDTFKDGMEGLIGYIGGQWQSVYFKSKSHVTLDLDYRTYVKVVSEAQRCGIAINNTYSEEFAKSNRIFLVKYVEEEMDIERKDGSKLKLEQRKFTAYPSHVRTDKQNTDGVHKVIGMLSQRRAENIL